MCVFLVVCLYVTSICIAPLPEDPKLKKSRKPALKKKSNGIETSTLPTSRTLPTCQTVHTNTTPILHSSIEMPSPTKSPQYPAISNVSGTSDHPQNAAPLLTFPSQLNATSFLAALSSTTTIPSRTRGTEASRVQKVRPLRPFASKSAIEHVPFVQKPAGLPSTSNQPNNVLYLPNTLHQMPNPNPKVHWSGRASSVPLTSLPQSNVEKPTAGSTMKNSTDGLPKMVYPYQIASSKSAMFTTSSTSKAPLKHQDLLQGIQNQQGNVNSVLTADSTIKGHSISTISYADKHHNTRTATKLPDSISQPLQYCGIILQPGMVPQVQLTGAAPRPPSIASSTSQEQNPYSNLYTLQGVPYGSNVANPAVLAQNTVIPYFLGIAQTGNVPKPIVPAATSPTAIKESLASTCGSTAPTSTSAIAAAYSAFVSIAPASVTNSSFSQQLVNLVSSYNNPYWQHLLTQGTNSNTLAYQLMQVGQYANARLAQATKTAGGKSQTKSATTSSSRSASNSQESKAKTFAKSPAVSNSVTSPSVVTTSSNVTTSIGLPPYTTPSSCVLTYTSVTTSSVVSSYTSGTSSCGISPFSTATSNVKQEKTSDCVINRPSGTVSVCTGSNAKLPSCSETKNACSVSEADSAAQQTAGNDHFDVNMDYTDATTVHSMLDNSQESCSDTGSERAASTNSVATEESICANNVASTKEISSVGVFPASGDTQSNDPHPKSIESTSIASAKDTIETLVGTAVTSTSTANSIPNKIGGNTNEKDVSHELSERKHSCTDAETDAISEHNVYTFTFDKSCDKDPGTIQSSSENFCKDNTISKDKLIIGIKPSSEVSRDFSTNTDDCSNPVTENSHSTKSADFVNETESGNKVDVCKMNEGDVNGNAYMNVYTNSEKTNAEYLNFTSSPEGALGETDSTSQNDGLDDKDSGNIEVTGEKRECNHNVKTGLKRDNDAKLVVFEKKDEKMNALKRREQEELMVETEETSKKLSKNQNCDGNSMIDGKEDKLTTSNMQNGENKSALNGKFFTILKEAGR